MLNVCVIGSGYVGLVAGACFADSGNMVYSVDIDQKKIDNLNKGIIPIFEPGLEKLIKKNKDDGRLIFSTSIKQHIEQSDLCFIAVGTPSDEDGSADLKYVLAVAKTIGECINKFTVIVDKSTVPVGTADLVKLEIQKQLDLRKVNVEFAVVSNPEFLREGAALEDFMKPDRVVIGSENTKASEIMVKLYSPFVRNNNPIMIMDIKSAELTKYAANAMLALRISYMNEIATLCEKLGANVDEVRRGIGADFRIGKHFLYSGIGYGGSCFPKDVKAIVKTASNVDYDFQIMKSAEAVNLVQKEKMFHSMMSFYNNNLKNKKIALWGLSFKPNTDDMRDAPSLILIDLLLKAGATISAFDPEAMPETKRILGDKIGYEDHYYNCLIDANALLIVTEWNDFRNPDFNKIKSSLKDNVIFDGRNVFNTETMIEYNFNYFSIGRKSINA